MGVYDHLRLPAGMAAEFIGVFMRAEYALKCARFCKEQGGAASADWDDFAEHISAKFDDLSDARFRESVAYLIACPPRKQTLTDGHLSWKNAPPPIDKPASFQALLMVRRVRNNLFHGGKFGEYRDDFYGPNRDEKLVDAANTVLVNSIALDELVARMYRT